ncbi:hypothetical protein [Streptomyces sp. ITFR-16]|uniref:hypothetical protein n=1 Tax=Streptomyces sp. ITFR-16 TaxID=3075198 RepID=UPI00288A92A4|nr:hypothetical protein [Streptomyces sp. ITFR-16]WNI23712.1 hypothetical protein RLT58_18090 [Streptomyces sp. ITFR-16]
MDDDRVFIRSRWGTNRYVYNPNNPIGRALIVGSLLFAAGGMYWLYHPDLFKGGWDEGELRSAVRGASAELSRGAQSGPGSFMFEDILERRIAAQPDGPSDGVSVDTASSVPVSDPWAGGAEKADYTVTARGTDAAFCVHVDAWHRAKAAGYAAVTVTADEGACATAG